MSINNLGRLRQHDTVQQREAAAAPSAQPAGSSTKAAPDSTTTTGSIEKMVWERGLQARETKCARARSLKTTNVKA